MAEAVFEGAWDELADLKEWDGALEELVGAELLYAEYDQGSYEGSAFALFRKDGKLYEAHCSHCSCYGLDNFDPEETTVAALKLRPTTGKLHDVIHALPDE